MPPRSAPGDQGSASVAQEPRVPIDALVRVNPQVAPETLGSLAVGASTSKFGVLPRRARVGRRGRWRPGRPDPLARHPPPRRLAARGRRCLAVGFSRWLSPARAAARRAAPTSTPWMPAAAFRSPTTAPLNSVPSAALFAAAAQAELDQIPAAARPRQAGRRAGPRRRGRQRLADRPRPARSSPGAADRRARHRDDRADPPGDVRRNAPDGRAHFARPADRSRAKPNQSRPFASTARSASRPIPSGVASLPPLERGDIVAIGMAGAYGSSMFSTYNGRPRPPEVAWDRRALDASCAAAEATARCPDLSDRDSNLARP